MFKEFVYIDSSQDESQIIPRQNQEKNMQQIRVNEGSSLHEQYNNLIKQLLNDKITNQTIKNLVTKIEDKELYHNVQKRNFNYKYFLDKMEIDSKYRALMEQKMAKVRGKNEMKRQVLQKVRRNEEGKREQNELEKFMMERNSKQEKVVKNIKKQVKKLGFERVHNAHRKIKEEVKVEKNRQEQHLASRMNKQRNELLELQQKFEQIKQAKRVNKIQQRKVISDLSVRIAQEKQKLKNKLVVKKAFQI